MEGKYREVEAWLEKLFGSQPVLPYEYCDCNLEILYNLMRRNKEQDAFGELIIKDYHQKSEEYSVEAERYDRILRRLGLSTKCLSQSGNISLKTLVQSALLLDVRSSSNSDIMLTMSEVSVEKMRIDDQRRLEKRLSAQLFSKTRAELQRSGALRKIMQSLDEKEIEEEPDLKKKGQMAGMLQIKSKEYQRSLERLKKELEASGADPSIYHGNLVKKSEELKLQKDKLHFMRAKLDSYHALPPDLSLAKVKVEEVKRELAALESELAQHIDLMHM